MISTKNKKIIIKSLFILLIISFCSFFVIGAVFDAKSFLNSTKNLAPIFDEDSLKFDRDYKKDYLNRNKNFSNFKFSKIKKDERIFLNIGAKIEKIKAFEVNKKNYVIDLISCDSYEKYCTFRINGIPTKKLHSSKDKRPNKKDTFDLDEDHFVKINSIEFDYCDGKRFCHLGYESYHKVEFSVEEKG